MLFLAYMIFCLLASMQGYMHADADIDYRHGCRLYGVDSKTYVLKYSKPYLNDVLTKIYLLLVGCNGPFSSKRELQPGLAHHPRKRGAGAGVRTSAS